MLLELFTDGSSFIKGKQRASSAAFQLYLENRLVISGGRFLNGGTNNSGESTAVLLGLDTAKKCLRKVRSATLKPPYTIKIYTDSLITRDACKSYIYKWVKTARDGVMYNSSNVPVPNQHIFKRIYDDYLTNDIFNLEFYHLNSHCLEYSIFRKNMKAIKNYVSDITNKKLREKVPDEIFEHHRFVSAKETFAKKNGMDITNEDLLRLLVYNMRVDGLASEILSEGLEEEEAIEVTK